MENTITIGVYGTLKQGFNNHKRFLEDAEFIGKDIIKGELYETRRYPMLTTGKDDIAIEIFKVDFKTFERLKEMEENAGYVTGTTITQIKKIHIQIWTVTKKQINKYKNSEWTKIEKIKEYQQIK